MADASMEELAEYARHIREADHALFQVVIPSLDAAADIGRFRTGAGMHLGMAASSAMELTRDLTRVLYDIQRRLDKAGVPGL